jgi:hypothetical protein
MIIVGAEIKPTNNRVRKTEINVFDISNLINEGKYIIILK